VKQRMWMWVGTGMLVSTMLVGGVAFAAGQSVSWQAPQATVTGSGTILPQAVELPNVQAPEAWKSLQPLAGQRLADGGDNSTKCGKPHCR
jgi:hypothetical protein